MKTSARISSPAKGRWPKAGGVHLRDTPSSSPLAGGGLIKILKFLLSLLLFLLPWQTILITQEQFLNGVKWQYGTIGFFVTEIILWVCVLLFVVWYAKKVELKIKNWKLEFRWSKDRLFVASCLLFIIYSFFSIIWAGDRQVAFQHAFHILEAFLLFFMLYLGPLSFRDAAKWFVAGAVVQSVLGIWQFLGQSTFAWKWLGLVFHPVVEAGTSIISSGEIGRWLRAYGSFSHPNVFGGYLVLSIILTLLLSLRLPAELEGEVSVKHETTKQFRFFQISNIKYQIVFLFQVAALFFTFSRSAWISFSIVILSYCFIIVQQKKSITYHLSPIIAAFVLVSILSVIYFPLIQTRFSNQSFHEVQSTSERVSGYAEAIQIFKKSPLLGVGAGNYTLAAYELDPNRAGWEYQPVHSVLLLILVEFGIIGILILMSLVVSYFRFQISDFRKFDAIYYLLFIIYFLPLLIFDHYLFSSYAGLLVSAIYLALVLKFFQTYYIYEE